MYHIFFFHSPVNGHLGCFHVLAIVNSAEHLLELEFSSFSYICPGVRLLDHMVTLVLVFYTTLFLNRLSYPLVAQSFFTMSFSQNPKQRSGTRSLCPQHYPQLIHHSSPSPGSEDQRGKVERHGLRPPYFSLSFHSHNFLESEPSHPFPLWSTLAKNFCGLANQDWSLIC